MFHVQFYYCFVTCIQVLQEADKVVWNSHLFKNFPQFVVIHTIKSFSIVNEAEVNVFLEFSRLEISSRKLDTKGTFHTKMGTIKDRNGMDLTDAEDTKKRCQEHTEVQKRSS